MSQDLINLGASAVHRLLGAGEITSAELVEIAAQRIAAVEPAVNALPTLCLERARAQAEAADRARQAGRPSLLGGLPLVAQQAQVPGGAAEGVGHRAEGLQARVGVGRVGEPPEHRRQQRLLDDRPARHPAGQRLEVAQRDGRLGEAEVLEPGAGGRAVAVGGDVSKAADAQRIVDTAIDTYGRLDVLVNNSGVYEFAPIEAITEEHYRRQFDTNVFGVLLTCANNWMSVAFHTYQSELFPTRVRAQAVGFVYSWSRFSAIFTSLMIGFLLSHFGVNGVFVFIAAAMLVAAVSIGVFGPRTSGLALEAIAS